MFEASALGDLPSVYDYTDPATNLSDYDRLMPVDSGDPLAGIVPDVLSENRFLWGADLIPTYLAAYHGYQRSGGNLLQALLWGLGGYMAPLPAVGLVVYEQTAGQRAF